MLFDAIMTADIDLGLVVNKLYPLPEQLLTLKHHYPNIVKSELGVIDLTLEIIEKASACEHISQLKDLSESYLRDMASHHERYGR
ncbi:MAG: hypothetical protein EBY16_02430 [Gammaproteobacteria bacterium]|nr:hypothetical protein [Gammaproteobacteria bacterium]